MVLVAVEGCTELAVAPYRDQALVRDYRYALGEKYIDVDGLRLCYQERGQGETVLVLPGLATSIDLWQLNIPALAEHCHVVALDPPGFGKSDKPDASYDLAWLRDRILAFMDARGIRRASLIGGSLGGQLALMVAMERPECVDKLVLMGSSGGWPPPGFLLAGGLRVFWNDALVTDHLRRNWPDIYHKMFIRQTPVTQVWFRYEMAVRADPARFGPEGRAASRALLSIFFHSCLGRLAGLRQPTLLIWGAPPTESICGARP
jgi:pimeloyl-ACP methyl ester carboxylesterase